jgi:hypothetical protein
MPRREATRSIRLPQEMTEFAYEQVRDIVRACMWEENIIKAIAISCYLQGARDALQIPTHRPTFLDELAAAEHVESPGGYGHGV